MVEEMKEALNEEAKRAPSEGLVEVIEATKELAKMASEEEVYPDDGGEDPLEGLNLRDIQTEDKKYIEIMLEKMIDPEPFIERLRKSHPEYFLANIQRDPTA